MLKLRGSSLFWCLLVLLHLYFGVSLFSHCVCIGLFQRGGGGGGGHNCVPLPSEEVHTIFSGGCSRL